MPQRIVREVRGIPLWLLREYLEEDGGRASGDGLSVAGEGWSVRLTQLEDFQVGSLRVGQLRVELEGDGEAFERMQALLEKKLLRAGG
ncbi:MAG: DUF1952 domain-containing protein [Planctomycetota bacterium]